MNAFDADIECVRDKMNERNKEWVHPGFTEHAESAAEENQYLYLADVFMRVLLSLSSCHWFYSGDVTGAHGATYTHTCVNTEMRTNHFSHIDNTDNMPLWIKFVQYLRCSRTVFLNSSPQDPPPRIL